MSPTASFLSETNWNYTYLQFTFKINFNQSSPSPSSQALRKCIGWYLFVGKICSGKIQLAFTGLDSYRTNFLQRGDEMSGKKIRKPRHQSHHSIIQCSMLFPPYCKIKVKLSTINNVSSNNAWLRPVHQDHRHLSLYEG
jgi:hypothetical protein